MKLFVLKVCTRILRKVSFETAFPITFDFDKNHVYISEAISEVKDSIKHIKLFCIGNDQFNNNAQDLNNLLQSAPNTSPSSKKEINFLSMLCYTLFF